MPARAMTHQARRRSARSPGLAGGQAIPRVVGRELFLVLAGQRVGLQSLTRHPGSNRHDPVGVEAAVLERRELRSHRHPGGKVPGRHGPGLHRLSPRFKRHHMSDSGTS